MLHILWFYLYKTLQINYCMLGTESEGRGWLQPVGIFLGDGTVLYSDLSGESMIMLLSKLRTVHFRYASIKWNTKYKITEISVNKLKW